MNNRYGYAQCTMVNRYGYAQCTIPATVKFENVQRLTATIIIAWTQDLKHKLQRVGKVRDGPGAHNAYELKTVSVTRMHFPSGRMTHGRESYILT